jgi:hypothetical protein
MFHGTAELLTLLSVLFHAGMGCCAHHDHYSAVGTSDPPVNRTTEAERSFTCSCAHHRDDDHSSGVNDSESGDDSCPCGHSHSDCTDHCAWLTASKVQVPADHVVVLPETMTNYGLSNMAATLAVISVNGDSLLTSHSGDSLRAVTQVWRL